MATPSFRQLRWMLQAVFLAGGVVGSSGSAFAQVTDFTVLPSVTTSQVGAGINTLDLLISCVDRRGTVLPNCDIVLTHRARPLSGGHAHDDGNRPAGTFTPSSGNSGAGGFLPVTYTAPEVGGIIDVTINSRLPNGIVIPPGTFTIGVSAPGLLALPPGTGYTLVGATATHPSNHFGHPTFNATLQVLGGLYAADFAGETLGYNDMSLVNGGLFDLDAAWQPPHFSHRFGTDIDVRLVAPERRARLRQLIRAADPGITIIVEGNHWHLRQ